jgi:hypothetical protein
MMGVGILYAVTPLAQEALGSTPPGRRGCSSDLCLFAFAARERAAKTRGLGPNDELKRTKPAQAMELCPLTLCWTDREEERMDGRERER